MLLAWSRMLVISLPIIVALLASVAVVHPLESRVGFSEDSADVLSKLRLDRRVAGDTD